MVSPSMFHNRRYCSSVPNHFCLIFSAQNLYEVFVVFHDDGYTVYEPNHCHTEHVVYGAFAQFRIRPEYGDTVKSLCEPNKTCVWGSAVNIKNQYIYITQPTLNRVVVIEITERLNPIEVGHVYQCCLCCIFVVLLCLKILSISITTQLLR